MADKKLSSVVKPGPAGVSTAAPANTLPGATKSSASAAASARSRTSDSLNLFHKENYLWMLAGLAIIALGMVLMSGGNSSDPNVFDQKQVYSTTRITVAPILIIIGLGLEVYAIFKKPKT